MVHTPGEMAHSGGRGGLQRDGDRVPQGCQGNEGEGWPHLIAGCLILSPRAQLIWHRGKGMVGWTENGW